MIDGLYTISLVAPLSLLGLLSEYGLDFESILSVDTSDRSMERLGNDRMWSPPRLAAEGR